jgi:hypothetical protein
LQRTVTLFAGNPDNPYVIIENDMPGLFEQVVQVQSGM